MEEKYANTQVTTGYEAMPGACTAPMTPPHSEYTGSERSASPAMSSLSSSDCSLVDSRSFESAELINASQQKSQDRGWAGLWTAVMATMAPAAFCLAASAAATPTTSLPSSRPSLPLLPSKAPMSLSTPSNPVSLPIKKRQIQATAKGPPT